MGEGGQGGEVFERGLAFSGLACCALTFPIVYLRVPAAPGLG